MAPVSAPVRAALQRASARIWQHLHDNVSAGRLRTGLRALYRAPRRRSWLQGRLEHLDMRTNMDRKIRQAFPGFIDEKDKYWLDKRRARAKIGKRKPTKGAGKRSQRKG